MRMRAIAGLFVLAMPGAVAANTVEDLQLWTVLSASGSIKGDLVGQIDLNARVSANQERVLQTLARGTVGYRVSPAVTLSIGYGHITGYRPGQRDNAEERLYPQVQWTVGKVAGGTLSTRARLEFRFVRPGSDTGLRYRQQLRWQRSLEKDGPSLVVQAEPFFALNRTDWGARPGFDQIRLMTGVAVPLSKRLTLETGYQVQYVRGATADRLNHVVPLTLAMRF